ncbi:hypothetical protein [Anaeromyxobacter oryzae]|uniref:Uncharacterized protein n=1 Tax=Anaeromyxobacter oryzae TaxID=2918170 RepID=A0ABN6MWS2_9BACT|nr:hypothetical protein [Anaeromyxobacter oryzae]BDG05439.1 hypothetical protein AMOR_44350 [Anaeromyxobacter oryzae]
MADQERKDPENEGEGNRSADRRYREGVAEHLRKGKVEQEAEDARRDVEANPDEFRRAEEEGKRHSAGDLPDDLAGKPSGE